MGHPGLLFIHFCSFKQTLQFLHEIYVKKLHQVYGAGIQTHDLQFTSLPPPPINTRSELPPDIKKFYDVGPFRRDDEK